MSGNVGATGSQLLPAYTFQDSDKIDLRRFCGYPAFGTGVVLFPEPWFFRYYLLMETRLNNLTSGEATVVLARLVELRTLETAIPAAGANLDTDQAAVWHHNRDETKHRMQLYRMWRLELCSIIGIPPGPNLTVGGGGTLRLVV